MTTHGKTVILKNVDIQQDTVLRRSIKKQTSKFYVPPKGINVAWKSIDKSNGEVYATLYGSDKANSPDEIIYPEDINNELCYLSKKLLSDRARTIKNRPQYQIINGRKELIR